MALSLAVHEGLKIAIGDHCLEVKVIMPPLRKNEANQIVISVDGGKEMLVTERSKTMVLPEVFVFSGRGGTGNTRRLAFEAPKRIAILRLP